MKTVAQASVQGIVCVCAGDRDITDEDWNDCIDFIKRDHPPGAEVRILVKALEASPNTVQRATLNALGQDRDVRVAVLTDSATGRGVIKAFGWMGDVGMKGFRPTELTEALDYLGAPADSRGELDTRLRRLRAQLA